MAGRGRQSRRSRCAREKGSILANWIAALGSHSELVSGLRGGQAADLTPFPELADFVAEIIDEASCG
jgi:hypothetical protein